MMLDLPRLLADFTPVRGRIKADYEDFSVEEIPLYAASGAGTHTYFLVEKRGISTRQAVHDLAQALRVMRRDIGVAGLKDARAVSRQWMSVEHVDPDQVAAIEMPRIRVMEVSRHTNKLKIGHLRGNRFVIRVRDTEVARVAELRAALDTLIRRGVPNFFGQQRFGYRGDTGQIGAAIVMGRNEDALDLICGRPSAHDHGAVRRARELYDEGKYDAALKLWPRVFGAERRALAALLRTRGDKRRAFGAIEKAERFFFASAFQSELFNRVAAQRLEAGLDRLVLGDLAWRHENGAVFRVEDVAVEQPRCDAFEISPSGPLFGHRCTAPSGEPAAMESAVLASAGLDEALLRNAALRLTGGRRPLRFGVQDADLQAGADERGEYIALRFALLRGCYATAVLRELFALEEGAALAEGEAAE